MVYNSITLLARFFCSLHNIYSPVSLCKNDGLLRSKNFEYFVIRDKEKPTLWISTHRFLTCLAMILIWLSFNHIVYVTRLTPRCMRNVTFIANAQVVGSKYRAVTFAATNEVSICHRNKHFLGIHLEQERSSTCICNIILINLVPPVMRISCDCFAELSSDQDKSIFDIIAICVKLLGFEAMLRSSEK